MSKMTYTNCPLPKKIGFLIFIEDAGCTGIPEEFKMAPSIRNNSDTTTWKIKESMGSNEIDIDALPILWEDIDASEKKEIFHRKRRAEERWRKEDFLWVTIYSDEADVYLNDLCFAYIDMC